MHSKSMRMAFVARIIRHKLCLIYAFFDFFVQKSFSPKNYFLLLNLTTRRPFYICLIPPHKTLSLFYSDNLNQIENKRRIEISYLRKLHKESSLYAYINWKGMENSLLGKSQTNHIAMFTCLRKRNGILFV